MLPHLSADGLCGALFVQHMVTQPSAHTADPSPPAEETLDCALNQPEVSWQHFLSRCVRTCKTLQELGQPSLNTSPHQLLLHSSCGKHKHTTGTGKSTKSVFSSLLKHFQLPTGMARHCRDRHQAPGRGCCLVSPLPRLSWVFPCHY